MQKTIQELFPKLQGNLGFGLMRLPHLENGEADLEQVKQMVDAYMEAGGYYFDTARVYGDSEETVRKALVERYPRESYLLATKNFAAMAKSAEAAYADFDKSLEMLGTDYVDFYLLHNLGENRTQRFEDYDMWDFVKKLKNEGKVRHIGFSFHDTSEVLEPILKAHPEVEFVQLQINYADWDSESVESRKCYELCRKYGKPVIVMEPIKGGMLADPPEVVREVLDSAGEDMSPAEWALRFALGLDDVMVVLSGMSTLEQMEQNIATWKSFEPLTDEQMKTIEQAQKKLAEVIYVPCTSCRYCMKDCPQELNIAGMFEALNRGKIYGKDAAQGWYGFSTSEGHKALDCIECGQCEEICPQSIDVISKLTDASEMFD